MYKEIEDIISESRKIAIFNHKNPDGDAMGSAYALKLALISMGKEAEVFLRSDDYSLPEYTYVYTGKNTDLYVSDCDLKIAVDSSDFERISDFKDFFTGNTIAIDHHVTHVRYAKCALVEPNAPAAGEVVFRLLKYMNINISQEIAHNLYVAISCDTGNFKYSSTTPETHRIAAELMETGIDVGKITKIIFDTKTMEYLKLQSAAIQKINLYENGKLAILSLDKSDFDSVGIKESYASGIVIMPSQIKGVEVGVYIRSRDKDIKVSLRSNSYIDVAKIALSFGGGGHVRAAGFSLDCDSLAIAEEIVYNALKKEFQSFKKIL